MNRFTGDALDFLKYLNSKNPEKIKEDLISYLKFLIAGSQVDYLNIFSNDIEQEVWVDFNSKIKIKDLRLLDILNFLEDKKIKVSIEEIYPEYIEEEEILEYLR
jgi:hypothetical protein